MFAGHYHGCRRPSPPPTGRDIEPPATGAGTRNGGACIGNVIMLDMCARTSHLPPMASTWVYKIATTPLLGRAVLGAYRAGYGLRYLAPPVGRLFRWVVRSREVFNYTYHLTPRNRLHLASFLSATTGAPAETFEGYFRELEEDGGLRDHLLAATLASAESFQADREVRYGRRIGWYALVRHLKPRLILETGVDKGLGACVLTAALLRNEREGHPGRYLGTDINPRAGYLLQAPYDRVGRLLYGDSIESIRRLSEPVDLYINDSDHSPAYEAREYQTVRPLLTGEACIIGDNAHETDELRAFCHATGRAFCFFKEQPLNHWYPGAGIGLGYRAGALRAPGPS
jgi:predicted O-methyltransferase YrrM